MNKRSLAIAMATAIAALPFSAKAEVFDLTYTGAVSTGSGAAADGVTATGVLTGSVVSGVETITGGTITITGLGFTGATGTLIANPNAPTAENIDVGGGDNIPFDDILMPGATDANPYVDNIGLLFSIDGIDVLLYSGAPPCNTCATTNGGPFTGAGTNDYGIISFDGSNSSNPPMDSGEMTLSATPEPSSLVLLGTGLLGLAGAARRRLSC